jgi:hypothetical protein
MGAVYAWLRATLAGHAGVAGLVGTRIGEHPLPPGPHPVVAWQVVDANDLRYVGGVLVWTNVLVQVVGWHVGTSMAACEALAAEIDDALHGGSGVVGINGLVLDCWRERPIYPPPNREEGDGVMYRQGGGEYRILARLTT